MDRRAETDVQELLRRIARRDEAAFRRLYELYGRRVLAFLLHRFQQASSIAEEVVSDTLLHVWTSPDSFRGESSFSTWLLGVARLKMFERLRRRPPDAEDVDALDEDLLVDDTRPEDAVAVRQRREGVRDCLDALPDAQRECMHLAYYEDWTLEEIAAHLGVQRETVGTRLFYARRKIRACLAALIARERGEAGSPA